jgi:hypothetical protein
MAILCGPHIIRRSHERCESGHQVSRCEQLLRAQRRIRPGAIVKIGHQHDIAMVGEAAPHAEERGPDAESVHIEDDRGVRFVVTRGEHVAHAVAVSSPECDLFFAHRATVHPCI